MTVMQKEEPSLDVVDTEPTTMVSGDGQQDPSKTNVEPTTTTTVVSEGEKETIEERESPEELPLEEEDVENESESNSENNNTEETEEDSSSLMENDQTQNGNDHHNNNSNYSSNRSPSNRLTSQNNSGSHSSSPNPLLQSPNRTTSTHLYKIPQWRKELEQQNVEQRMFRKSIEDQYGVNLKLVTKDGFTKLASDVHEELKTVRKKYTNTRLSPYVPEGKYEEPKSRPSNRVTVPVEATQYYRRIQYHNQKVKARNEEVIKAQAEKKRAEQEKKHQQEHEDERIREMKRVEENRRKQYEREQQRIAKSSSSQQQPLQPQPQQTTSPKADAASDKQRPKVSIDYPKLRVPANPKTPNEIEQERKREFLEEHKRKKDFSFLKSVPTYTPPPILFLRDSADQKTMSPSAAARASSSQKKRREINQSKTDTVAPTLKSQPTQEDAKPKANRAKSPAKSPAPKSPATKSRVVKSPVMKKRDADTTGAKIPAKYSVKTPVKTSVRATPSNDGDHHEVKWKDEVKIATYSPAEEDDYDDDDDEREEENGEKDSDSELFTLSPYTFDEEIEREIRQSFSGINLMDLGDEE